MPRSLYPPTLPSALVLSLNLTLSLTVIPPLTACQPASETAAPPALLEAAEQGDLARIETLLRRHSPDTRDACDWTPLMKAALSGQQAAVERLLDAGAMIDAVDNGGYTAMQLAASNDHAGIVALLLARGAMVDHQEATQGWTALNWAAGKGYTRTVAVLLEHGADPTLRDFQGQTAADRARAAGQTAVLALLPPAPR